MRKVCTSNTIVGKNVLRYEKAPYTPGTVIADFTLEANPA